MLFQVWTKNMSFKETIYGTYLPSFIIFLCFHSLSIKINFLKPLHMYRCFLRGINENSRQKKKTPNKFKAFSELNTKISLEAVLCNCLLQFQNGVSIQYERGLRKSPSSLSPPHRSSHWNHKLTSFAHIEFQLKSFISKQIISTGFRLKTFCSERFNVR